jgi:RNA-directed DNA polymerase
MFLSIAVLITAPVQHRDGTCDSRVKGTPQGGVISPILANLFLHYAFDRWMNKHFPNLPFCRYADDGLIHCRTEKQALFMKNILAARLRECGLELHPNKTKIVYCKDRNRQREYRNIQFEFLGYAFRPRRSFDRHGRLFTNFTPAISPQAAKALRQEVRSWRLQLKSDKSIEDLARMFDPIISGWVSYYCHFYASAFNRIGQHINRAIARWAMRKYKHLNGHKIRASRWVKRLAKQYPQLFAHWKYGIFGVAP